MTMKCQTSSSTMVDVVSVVPSKKDTEPKNVENTAEGTFGDFSSEVRDDEDAVNCRDAVICTRVSSEKREEQLSQQPSMPSLLDSMAPEILSVIEESQSSALDLDEVLEGSLPVNIRDKRIRSVLSITSNGSTSTSHTDQMIADAELTLKDIDTESVKEEVEFQTYSSIDAAQPAWCGMDLSMFGLAVKSKGDDKEAQCKDTNINKKDEDSSSCNPDQEDNLSCFLEVNASESTHQMCNIKSPPTSPRQREDFKTKYSRALARAAMKNMQHQVKKAEMELKKMKLETMRIDEDVDYESEFDYDDETSVESTDDFFEYVGNMLFPTTTAARSSRGASSRFKSSARSKGSSDAKKMVFL